ncbi:MAG: hypothetical protein HY788_05305 [Deltaproteobacteria bacterium]|nr:hypothetical protein [Deltaproteobacteria bacterium]
MANTSEIKKSLIVVTDESKARKIVQQVRIAGYEPAVLLTVDEALKLMAFINYDLVVMDEDVADKDKRVLAYVLTIPMQLRRKTLFVLIGTKYATNDRLNAFVMGLDALINYADIERLAGNLQMIEKEHRQFYRLFYNIIG